MKSIRYLDSCPQVSISALFMIVVGVAASFWFLTSSSGLATPNQCTFCHKRTTPMTLACNDSEYQRHLDHGDTVGACMTPIAKASDGAGR